MSDRLALANAIEDAGIERGKAEQIATAIARFVEANVATKADVQALGSELRVDLCRQDVAIERLRAAIAELENRLTRRLGGMVAAGVAVIVALQHFWR